MRSETVLAFDFGEKRIGVAVGDRVLGIAHPISTIEASDRQRRFAAIAALVNEWCPTQLVVGLPRYADGSEHALSRRCRRFAQQLQGRFSLPVELIDEQLTSAAAAMLLNAADNDMARRVRKRKTIIDQVAAQQILEDYFETAGASRA